ncbi:type II toxin-antitoxin system RelE family toxin [Pseudomonas sp. SMN5]
MGVDYGVEWDPKALKELRKLDGAIRLQHLKKLQERQSHPRVPGDAL